jgi:hypothetical protein
VYLQDALGLEARITIKLSNPDKRDVWSGRAGIMVRNDIAAPGVSPGYLVLGASPSNGWSLEWDADSGGRAERHTPFDGYTEWPHWLRLEKRGNLFTGYVSTDDATWHTVGATQDVGLFACASALFEGLQVATSIDGSTGHAGR